MPIARSKKRLGQASPPILYGCGNAQLLESPVSALLHRDVSEDDLAYTETFAKTAESGFSVVSGGAKGVDQAAMLAALEIEGNVVGVLADGLLQATTSRRYRPHLAQNNLLLITPFSLEAGFNAGNAMQRNKYIYCLSDAQYRALRPPRNEQERQRRRYLDRCHGILKSMGAVVGETLV